MASPPSPEASEIRRRGRRRLIGAVAIVLLLIVFVPMVLDSEPRPSRREPEMQIPPRDKAPPLPPPAAAAKAPLELAMVPPKSAELTRGGPPEDAPRPAQEPAKPAGAPKVQFSPVEAAKAPVAPVEAPKAPPVPISPVEAPKAPAGSAKPGVDATKASPTPPAPSPRPSPRGEGEKSAGPKLEGFVIQVGAFREEEKLQQAREKLAAAGVVHYTERLDNPAGALTRLRAGPFPTRAAADAALAKIKPVAPDGKVVPLP